MGKCGTTDDWKRLESVKGFYYMNPKVREIERFEASNKQLLLVGPSEPQALPSSLHLLGLTEGSS